MTLPTIDTGKFRRPLRRFAAGLLLAAAVPGAWLTAPSAQARGNDLLALSEIKREELPAPGTTAEPATEPENPGVTVPAPDPISPGVTNPAIDDPQTVDPAGEKPESADPARPDIDPNGPIPAVEYDLAKLPAPVRELHDKIVAAAKAGQIEAVRTLLATGDDATQLSLAGSDSDPIAFLKSLSGDEGGQEILAILLEVLDAGYVHLNAGTPEELYVWPYFFAVPLDKLTDPQRVELFKLVTSGDYEDMKSFGAYIFYRVGISPDGKWRFFLAGE